MKLDLNTLTQQAQWAEKGVALPAFDVLKMRAATQAAPVWVHFGAGNIFRGFIARLQQALLNAGKAQCGVIAAETFDYDIVNKIYKPFDELTLMVGLKPDGTTEREIVASVADSVRADTSDAAEFARLERVFESPSLQMASFTITEKGYALRDLSGEWLPVVKADIENGPDACRHAMSVVVRLMLARYHAGAQPMALVSMDNCSHNGEKLRASVTELARAWRDRGFADDGFVRYIEDEARVSFPWSMIDKITPRPAPVVEKALMADSIEDMHPIVTSRGTYIAPFVNAEIPQYLVIEDRFPNGRPAFEQARAGVYMTDRDTVNKTERMKVTTCLNPLHTALAVYGCLLGYELIADEMRDPELKRLVEHIGNDEGMPVVTDPGIIDPKAFLNEVLTQRFPNPFMPDTPQRIATDTSQKVAIRFGETIKSYAASDKLDAKSLTFIPLAIAGWLRYLLGVDDRGKEMSVSADPMLDVLQAQLRGVTIGKPDTLHEQLVPILSNEALFGVDLIKVGLGERIADMLRQMLEGAGAVRATLKRYLD